MGKHAAAADAQHPTEVSLERVAEALRGLGFASVQRDDAPDRLVVAALSFTAAVWIDYRQPMALVVDTAERIPTDFEHATALARFINTWNHDRVGPAASYRLAESGDFTVRMRRPIHIKHGLTDEQLGAELVDTLGGSDITPATRLDEAGLTSLDRIELAVRIEEEFAVRIDEHVYATHDTAGELAHYIEEQQ